MGVHLPNFTLGMQVSEFEFTFANDNLHSPWQYSDVYEYPWIPKIYFMDLIFTIYYNTELQERNGNHAIPLAWLVVLSI